VYKTWHFSTLSLPFFTYYYDLFYINNKKRIPNNISEMLTPIALAYWIISDGYKYKKGLALATNSFSIYENEVLVNALNNNFKFTSRIIKDHDKPSIFIPSKNLICLQNLVLDYMHPTLLYKIHL
jgi:hypothetical protein